jgi:ribosomal protein L11 methyltransferase
MVPPRLYPALDFSWPSPPAEEAVERLLAAVDLASPTAAEPHSHGIRVFFATPDDRERAAAEARAFDGSVAITPLDVSDESWAERSQAGLQPVTIGGLTIAPPWTPPDGDRTWISIQPSMGFGTGHHQSTRLCLGLLQTRALAGRSVVDVGTGSGVLAIAAARLGASLVVGLDSDPDALAAAQENVERNLPAGGVTLKLADLGHDGVVLEPGYDVLLANLTGATLARLAPLLTAAVSSDGALIVSGLQASERDDVVAAFGEAGARLEQVAAEDDWLALLLGK